MSAADTVGRHRVRRVPPSHVHVVYQGDVTTEEARRLSELLSLAASLDDRRFIVDLRALGNIPPDVRRAMVPAPCRTRAIEPVTLEVAFVGARLRAKVLMTALVTAAASANQNVRIQVQFFDGLDQALRWVQYGLTNTKLPSNGP